MITAVLLLFGGFAQAAPLQWFDLEVGQQLELTQEVVLGGSPFRAGTRLWLENKEPVSIPGAPMSFYALYQSPCENPNLQSDLEIVLPVGNPEGSSVGVELSQGCNWGIYVEDKDAFTPSFFATP